MFLARSAAFRSCTTSMTLSGTAIVNPNRVYALADEYRRMEPGSERKWTPYNRVRRPLTSPDRRPPLYAEYTTVRRRNGNGWAKGTSRCTISLKTIASARVSNGPRTWTPIRAQSSRDRARADTRARIPDALTRCVAPLSVISAPGTRRAPKVALGHAKVPPG